MEEQFLNNTGLMYVYVNRFSYSDMFSPDVPFYAPMPYRRQLHAIRVDPFVFKDYTNYFYILNCSVTPV
jgi:hypothetical protein